MEDNLNLLKNNILTANINLLGIYKASKILEANSTQEVMAILLEHFLREDLPKPKFKERDFLYVGENMYKKFKN